MVFQIYTAKRHKVLFGTKFESREILLFQIQTAKGHRVVLATKFESRKILFQI